MAITDATSDAVIADAVWNAATASYGTAGTYGALIESGNVGGGAIVAASVTGAVGSVTGAVGSVTGSVGSVATGGIVAASFAAGAIDAAAIATGAIDADAIAANALDASALATDAITEITTGVLTTAMTEAYAADGAAPTLAQAQNTLSFSRHGLIEWLTKC